MFYRVKIISRYYHDDLEKEINAFLSNNTDIRVIDIKFDAQNETKDTSAFIIYGLE